MCQPAIPLETQDHLNRLRAHDPNALNDLDPNAMSDLNALVAHTRERLRQLASQMLCRFPRVRRWEQTDDVLQNALVRLCRALRAEVPENARHYYNLATLQIRRELLDLAAKHRGARGFEANHHTDGAGVALAGAKSTSKEPSSVAEWADFFRLVDTLPDEEREVFGLLWYQGLTQQQAAEIMSVDVRTVKRRWQSAKLALARALGGNPPPARTA